MIENPALKGVANFIANCKDVTEKIKQARIEDAREKIQIGKATLEEFGLEE